MLSLFFIAIFKNYDTNYDTKSKKWLKYWYARRESNLQEAIFYFWLIYAKKRNKWLVYAKNQLRIVPLKPCFFRFKKCFFQYNYDTIMTRNLLKITPLRSLILL